MKTVGKLISIACLVTVLSGRTTVSMAGYIRFMEGNSCTQNAKGETTDAIGGIIDFTNTQGFTNDDARSMGLFDVQPGTLIRVFDSEDGTVKLLALLGRAGPDNRAACHGPHLPATPVTGSRLRSSATRFGSISASR